MYKSTMQLALLLIATAWMVIGIMDNDMGYVQTGAIIVSISISMGRFDGDR